MKTLYLDLGMGAAGDMLSAALSELIDDREGVIAKLNEVFAPHAFISATHAEKYGISGTHMTVKALGQVEGEETDDVSEHVHDHTHGHGHDHDHGHSVEGHHHRHVTLDSVREFIGRLDLPESVKADALAVYDVIAEAEAHVHGMTPDNIHFHEVGSVDAMADIVMVCYLIDLISPDRIIASPIQTGFGTVKCAHGILPVPAPATAFILTGVPSYQGDISGEMCTPTGAALVKHFADKFGSMPVMSTERIGYGCGTKDFPRANLLRAVIGEAFEDGIGSYDTVSDGGQNVANRSESDFGYDGTVIELACNIDDMTGEDLGYAAEKLLEEGARDVFFTHVTGKKFRPAVILSVLCAPKDEKKMAEAIFKYTTTLGIRRYECPRYELKRSFETVTTPLGEVRMKVAEGYGVKRSKPEYEDLKKIVK